MDIDFNGFLQKFKDFIFHVLKLNRFQFVISINSCLKIEKPKERKKEKSNESDLSKKNLN